MVRVVCVDISVCVASKFIIDMLSFIVGTILCPLFCQVCYFQKCVLSQERRKVIAAELNVKFLPRVSLLSFSNLNVTIIFLFRFD